MNKHQYNIGIEKLPTESDVFSEFGKIMFELKDFNKSEDMGALIVRELTERVIKHVKLSVKTNDLSTAINSDWLNKSQDEVCTLLSDTGEQKKTCDYILVGSVDTQDGVSCFASDRKRVNEAMAAAIENAVSNAKMLNDGCAVNDKAQQLLDFLARLENATYRGLEINQERNPSIPAEKVISTDQCEWILKDCALFRSAICDAFGLPQ
ncbi:TPA: hypothetical protein ACQVH3_004682 [Serratia marcescens]